MSKQLKTKAKDDLFDGNEPKGRASSAKAVPRTSGGEADYTAADIEVLEGLEPVRRRPACISAAPTKKRCITSSRK